MEEDGIVKAPMTRLRRRLSVETDDTKSPANTPTKKRGGKLAAKPQLDLIEENAIQNSPKRATRRSITKELVDTPVEKHATPARRSTRIKSNTSLLSESIQGLDSPRAKRAARRTSTLDSDTEISNTPTRRTRKDSSPNIDKLAVENPVTPARVRRTKKESTSIADAEVESNSLLKEVITEEPEIKDAKNDRDSKVSSPRKSPRIAKKDRRSTSSQPDESIDKMDSKDKKLNKVNEQDDDVDGKPKHDSKTYRLSLASANLIENLSDKANKTNSLNKSSSAAEILNNSQSKRQRTKSWTTLTSPAQTDNPNFFSDNERIKKKKYKNDKSFNNSISKGSGDGVLNVSQSNTSLSKLKRETNEKSDSSINKSKNRKEIIDSSFTSTELPATNDSIPVNTSNESNKENEGKNDIDLLFKMKPINVQSMVLVDDSDTDSLKQIETGDQCVPVVDHQLNKDNELALKENRKSEVHNNIFNVFQTQNAVANSSVEPMDIDETITNSLILNDSNDSIESNTKANESINRSRRKTSLSNQSLKEEQISHETSERANKSARKSSLNNTDPSEETTAVLNKSNRKATSDTQGISSNDAETNLNNSKSRKSSVNISEEPNESINKSKRKSKNSISISQDHEKSETDNKSTLVLSEIKDTSMGNNVTKMQDKSAIDSDILSNSITNADIKKSANLKVSNDYMTSTPVQDKNVKKLALQMNTSVITPADSKKDKKVVKIPVKDESINSEDTDSSDDEDESKSKNSLVIDEAEDAGDDYQSGDSQDEEERLYEEENELKEKGETLDSEQDFTNESDYEKDSFVVSSDEEDNELLSGSGDDLTLSDNELTMSAKSKKKFDEKAKKLQKKASREMYEARHKLDKSGDNSKEETSNKKNRLRLDSTQSGDEMKVKKNNKRMRLDTYDSSNADQSITEDFIAEKCNETTEEIGHKKKKAKRLSESVCEGNDVTDSVNTSKNKKKSKRLSESMCNQSVLKEHEITMTTINENGDINEDPLLVKVKVEPKTPQKDLDISTVNVTYRDDVEQVNIDENASMLKPNDTIDPLQSTIAANEDDDSEVSSISENEEITNNYDAILKELNKERSKKIKTNDISLDNSNKAKKKNGTIIEQLNITQPKSKKTPKKNNLEEKTKQKNNISNLNEDSSDSIDLKLLFSDDSNDSAATSNKGNDAADSFIPLKRTEGKTNIRVSIGNTETTKNDSLLNTSTKSKNKNRKSSASEVVAADPIEMETSLNTSSKKKKKNRKSSQSENVTESNSVEEESPKFFIDTEGAHSETNNALNTNSSEKQKPNRSANNIAKDDDSDGDAPMEVSFKFEKNDKKDSESNDISDQKQNTSIGKNPKKNNKSLVQQNEASKGDAEAHQNKPNSKKRKRSMSEDKEPNNMTSIESQSKNKKKKKLTQTLTEPLASTSVSPKVRKDTAQIHKIFGDDPSSQSTESLKRSKKRKEREDDLVSQKAKIIKEDSDKHVPRLPSSILNKLADKPNKEFLEMKKSKLISTCKFVVENTKVKRKNKPSNYLEESVYLNDDPISPLVKKKAVVKKPKVLPFMPTVSTSDSGFTTKFQVNVLPQKIEFSAQPNPEIPNFKNKHLQDRKMKKLRTYDMFKQNRHIKLSKY